jgi:cytochrome P450
VHENALHEDDMSTERLKKEAMVLLGTGATTTRAVTIGIFELLSNPEKRMTLERELAVPMANWPREKPSLRSLENLPYLQAVIQESLRYVHTLFTLWIRWLTVYKA